MKGYAFYKRNFLNLIGSDRPNLRQPVLTFVIYDLKDFDFHIFALCCFWLRKSFNLCNSCSIKSSFGLLATLPLTSPRSSRLFADELSPLLLIFQETLLPSLFIWNSCRTSCDCSLLRCDFICEIWAWFNNALLPYYQMVLRGWPAPPSPWLWGPAAPPSSSAALEAVPVDE